MCSTGKTGNSALLLFELTAHDQRNQWANNSKTNKARVYILAHNTHFDKLSSPVKFHLAIFLQFKSYGKFR